MGKGKNGRGKKWLMEKMADGKNGGLKKCRRDK